MTPLNESSSGAPDQLTLALDRTYLAHERTLMAWTRTATSLIAFGFTLYKFFEYLHEKGQSAPRRMGAREFGLLMIGIGVLVLVLASAQHFVMMRRLKASYAGAPFSLALLLAALISCLGILGFISGVIGP
jgi:putative membrane protein